MEDWPQLQFCKQCNSGSTAVVTMSPDTAGTAMLEEERSYIDSGTSPIKKNQQTALKPCHMKLVYGTLAGP